MAEPTISYFGQFPTTILFQTTSGFNGGAQTGAPVLTPGVYTFSAQPGGGHYNFHDHAVKIHGITFKGAGSLVVKKDLSGQEAKIAEITSGEGERLGETILAPGESLKFYSTGAGTLTITGSLMTSLWVG